MAVAFVGGYLLLDWVSYIHPMQALNIAPWNPQPALAIALLAVRGLAWTPLVFFAALTAEAVVRGALLHPASGVTAAAVLTLGYTAIAWMLRTRFRVKLALDRQDEVVRLTLVVVVGALAIAVLYVASLFVLGMRTEEGLVVPTLKFWIGDAVGILVTLPVVFMVLDVHRRARIKQLLKRLETHAQVVAIALMLWLVFGVLGHESVEYFYLLFLPLVWVAVRAGLVGAVLAVAAIQWGIIVALQLGGAAALTVFEVQGLQIALTIVALFLGVAVDEGERAANQLRLSAHLAAAGNIAGAIAHELNQPLTAMSGYAKAIECLLRARDPMRRGWRKPRTSWSARCIVLPKSYNAFATCFSPFRPGAVAPNSQV